MKRALEVRDENQAESTVAARVEGGGEQGWTLRVPDWVIWKWGDQSGAPMGREEVGTRAGSGESDSAPGEAAAGLAIAG